MCALTWQYNADPIILALTLGGSSDCWGLSVQTTLNFCTHLLALDNECYHSDSPVGSDLSSGDPTSFLLSWTDSTVYAVHSSWNRRLRTYHLGDESSEGTWRPIDR